MPVIDERIAIEAAGDWHDDRGDDEDRLRTFGKPFISQTTLASNEVPRSDHSWRLLAYMAWSNDAQLARSVDGSADRNSA